jgi:hypothetical protein
VGQRLPTGSLNRHEGVGGLAGTVVERLPARRRSRGDFGHLPVQVLVQVAGNAGAVRLDSQIGIAFPLLLELHRLDPQGLDGHVAPVQEVARAQEGE